MRTHRLFITILGLAATLAAVGCQSQQNDDVKRGFQSLDNRDYDQAMAAADQFLARNPAGNGAAEATYLRGRAVEQRVKHSDAQAKADLRDARWTYLQALDLGPSTELEGYIRTSLANVCYWQDDYANAEAQWTQALPCITRDDLKAWVLYRIGLSQQRLGNWASADSTFLEVQRLFPGTEAAARSLSHHGYREFNIQVAAFSNPTAADQLAARLRRDAFSARRVEKPQRGLHIVMVGPVATYPQALTIRNHLTAQQYKDTIIVP